MRQSGDFKAKYFLWLELRVSVENLGVHLLRSTNVLWSITGTRPLISWSSRINSGKWLVVECVHSVRWPDFTVSLKQG